MYSRLADCTFAHGMVTVITRESQHHHHHLTYYEAPNGRNRLASDTLVLGYSCTVHLQPRCCTPEQMHDMLVNSQTQQQAPKEYGKYAAQMLLVMAGMYTELHTS
jgi:hypothetical protein